jgi:aryl carrier-like protein
MYGPTETAIHCTLQPRLSTSASTKMIGFPLDTVSAFVVSPLSEGESPSAFSILPIGEEGELAVGGPQVAEEYLNRPELTATSFIHHPDYGYLYRTGDRAKLRLDGTLECLGRVVTGQVKLRGQRIELGEIEQIIMKVESCRATTVLIIEEVLVAFCATGSRKASRADVLKTCKQWLPGIMVPSEVIFMNHMPQLPSGKIDRNSLVTTFRQTLQRDVSKPRDLDTVTDDTVLEILQQSLQKDLVPGSSLASAGLDSLQAIRLASRVRSQGYHLTALDVLSATTVDDLLQVMKSTKPTNNIWQHEKPSSVGDTQQDIPELEKWHTKIACTLPCTPQQEAMLAETIARPKAYCNWVEIELTMLHTIQEIQTALQQLAQGNEILRSGFYPAMMKDGTFVQVVWKELDVSCIQHVGEFSRLYSLGSYESLLRPLSIQAKTHNGKSRLLLQIHHALYDGWSLDLILQDLGDLLHGRNAIQRQQFREVIQFYNDHTPASRSADEEYWAEFLRDRPELSLPNFNGKIIENAATCSFAGRSAVKLQSLHERSREITVNPQVYFQAATAFVFSLYFGRYRLPE